MPVIIKKQIASILIVCMTHNSIAAVYWITVATFFLPFPAFADNFLDKAAEGKLLGNELMSTFSVPDVNSTTGQITLKNGLAAGQTIEQNELFQEIEPGSLDEAAASYGNNAAQGIYVNNKISHLTTGTSQHAYAYQTLLGASTAMPNMLHDPIWNQSDSVLSLESPLITDMFSGCQRTTTWSETNCPIHIEDLKQCKKSLKTESCQVTRSLAYDPVMGFVSGNGNISLCGIGCSQLNLGVSGDNTFDVGDSCQVVNRTATWRVLRPDAIKRVTIDYVRWDDETKIEINGTLVYTGSNGFGGVCEQSTSWAKYPNVDVTDFFRNASPGDTITVKQIIRVGGGGEGYARLKVIAEPDVKEQFIDSPSGCRQRLFNAWPLGGTAPEFVSSGSLNDEASTNWWQCTEASDAKVVGPITITPSNYTNYISGEPILPEAPSVPPASICYKAQTRIPGRISLGCYTDYQGYEVCPEYDYDSNEHNTCESLSSCAYVKEECEKDSMGHELIDPVTGVCRDFIVTYDCGTDHDSTCDVTNNGQNTICDAQIRCMGGECVDPKQESNDDFIKAATALQALNESQKQLSCDPMSGACKFFAGEALECQMADLSVLGSVDCCNMPIQGSWIDYIWLAKNSWDLADTSVEIAAFGLEHGASGLSGAWGVVSSGSIFGAPVDVISSSYTAITDTFTSMYDSVVSMLGEEISSTLTSISLDAIKQQAVQWLGEWIASTFGEAAASTLLSATTSTVGSAVTTTYSMAGSLLSSIVTVVGIIYAIYQIAKLVVSLVFACTEEEIKLQMYKDQKMCTKPDEIGTYCSVKILGSCVAEKQVYCCFTSPFARVFQQQARKQLDLGFGEPKTPSCEGLRLEQIGKLDFDKMDFGEWINMLKVANVMPLDGAKIDEMYSPQFSTTGNLPNTDTFNVFDRLNEQTQGTNIDEQRQFLIDNL